MPFKSFNSGQIADFHRDGYVLVSNFCSQQETDKLYKTALEDGAKKEYDPALRIRAGKKGLIFNLSG